MKSLEEIRAFFNDDRFAVENGAEILEVGEGYALCRMPITARHRNARGAVMGGAVFTLADFAFAVAANHEVPSTVTLNANINFLASPKGDEMFAEARAVKVGRSSCCYRVQVKDGEGRAVAEVSTCGFVLTA